MSSIPPPQQPRPKLYYFCDETSFIGEDYMGVGGLAIRKERIPEIAKALGNFNQKRNARGEIKWENTRDLNLTIRKDYIDYMVSLIQSPGVHLHVRFAPFASYDHKISGPRRVYDTVSKMYYQLLLHRTMNYYGSSCQLFIRPDDGACTSELEKFIDALHIDYNTTPGCVDSIVCLNSTSEPLLQFLDVSLGALCAYRNGRHLRKGTSEAKRTLAGVSRFWRCRLNKKHQLKPSPIDLERDS
jgi:hypothetical protein